MWSVPHANLVSRPSRVLLIMSGLGRTKPSPVSAGQVFPPFMSAHSTVNQVAPEISGRRPAQPSSGLTPVAWTPPREIDLAEWTAVGRRLGTMGRCGQWGLGDWIRYGNAKFGERYTRAARITGYDVQTLMNMVYVATRFEISRRRETLSWSHHETLASLEPDEQEHWLDRAATERLSISDLRVELRGARRGRKPAATEVDDRRVTSFGATALICPHCGKPVPFSQDADFVVTPSATLGPEVVL